MKASSFRYLINQGFKGIWKNRMMTFASFCILLVSLLMVGTSVLVSINLTRIIGGIEDKSEVIVIVKDGTSQADMQTLENKLKEVGNINTVSTFGVGIPKKLCISGKVGERFILNSCVAYKALLAVFSPLAIVSGAVSAGILRLFGVKSTNKADAVTEEEILMMVDAVNETGGIEESQAEMISNIFDFDDIEVREVMTHRTEMVAIEENSTLSEAVKLVIGEGFSRIPVYCDNADNISGVIFAKDLLRLVFEEDKKERPVKEFMRDITFVPESNKCGELFKEFTEDKTQIAVVVDDYGGTAGIITMEDLLETIVGSIQDEYDDETEEIQKVSSDCYDMVGTAAFDDVMEALGKEYHGEVDYDTIGGFVMDLLGHVPEDNEKVTVHWENVEFKVLSIHEKKIERLRAVIKRDNEEVTD